MDNRCIARGIFEDFAGEPLPGWDAVEETTELVTTSPGDYLFQVGDTHPFVYCVRTGLLKRYYHTPSGMEWVKGFSAERSCFASARLRKDGGQTTFSVVAIETAVLEKIDYGTIQQLAKRHTGWRKVLTKLRSA